MKYLSYEGLQYLYSKILTRLGLKVDATGGDISETVIETLDTVEDKYPIPAAGESVKRFFGKVLEFLKNIRPLTENINIYVSTTGSDILGDGTSGNPFKTIQHAIDILPKDLGGCNAIVTVLAGTYDEDVLIRSFHGGTLRLESDTKDTDTGTCYVRSIIAASFGAGYMLINGFNLTTTTRAAVQVLGCHNVHINYCQSTVVATSQDGIDVYESFGTINNCKIANRYVAASFSNSRGTSANWSTGSIGNVVGIACTNGASVQMTGSQPIGSSLIFQGNGGTLTYQNGTQISYVNSGLACTWGTISGGYYRHGVPGTSMITIQISVTVTSPLTAGTQYYISGLPIPNISVPVSCQVDGHFDYKAITGSGQLLLKPQVGISVSNLYYFNATYLSNS